MRWVVDAASVTAYLLGDALAVERQALRNEAHAPALLDVEVTQVLRNLLRGGRIDPVVAGACREDLDALRVRRHPDRVLLARAWELRDVCTTYDALYVALAEALEASLVTRDRRLARAAGPFVEVTHIP